MSDQTHELMMPAAKVSHIWWPGSRA